MKKRILIFVMALLLAIQTASVLPLFATEETTFAASDDTPVQTDDTTSSDDKSPSDDMTESDDIKDGEEGETESTPIVIPENADSFLVFEGYQIRETDYNGLRSMFVFDRINAPTMDKDGYEVIEYGTLMAATDNLSKLGQVLEVSKNGEEYTAVSCAKKIAIMQNGKNIGKMLSFSSEEIKYACTVTNFTVKNFDKNVSIRGYAVLKDADENEYVVYADIEDESYRVVNLEGICNDMYADGTITKNNISYKNTQSFRNQVKEEEGWGPVWRP